MVACMWCVCSAFAATLTSQRSHQWLCEWQRLFRGLRVLCLSVRLSHTLLVCDVFVVRLRLLSPAGAVTSDCASDSDCSEDYEFSLPSVFARSILTVPWVELGDKVTVHCPQTGYAASIVFHTKVLLSVCLSVYLCLSVCLSVTHCYCHCLTLICLDVSSTELCHFLLLFADNDWIFWLLAIMVND